MFKNRLNRSKILSLPSLSKFKIERFIYKNNKLFWLVLLALSLIGVCILAFLFQDFRSAEASGNIYIVDGSVSTNGNGSPASPFKTIQACSNIVIAGDTCEIKAGTYRETISVQNNGTKENPITFRPYQNEKVVITGLDKLTPGQNGFGSWQNHSGNIYKIEMPSSMDFGKNQVFIDSQIQIDARWPNMPNAEVFIKRNDYAISSAGQLVSSNNDDRIGRLKHPEIPSSSGGAKITFNPGKESKGFIGTVTNYSSGQVDFSYNVSDLLLPDATPSSDDPFMLWGKLELLDTEKEFFVDKNGDYGGANTLYVYGNPSTKNVEIKSREVSLFLDNREFIDIKNLNFRVGGLQTDNNSKYINFDGINSEFGFYNMWNGLDAPSLLLQGQNNQLINSNIYNTGSHAIDIRGNAEVKNNVFFNTGYNMHLSDGVQTVEAGASQIKNNTVFATNQLGISFTGLKNGRVTNNHIFGIGYQLTDTAGINSWNGGDGEGTQISYNVVQDVIAYDNPIGNHAGGSGIRLDSGNAINGNCNFVIHHNLTFKTTKAGAAIWGLNEAQKQACHGSNYYSGISNGNKLYNNTFDQEILMNFNDLSGTELKNNLITKQVNGTLAGVDAKNNTFDVSDTNFLDKINQNYHLRATSVAIDSGIELSPYTDGFVGLKPDLGAFETGKNPWLAGAVILENSLSNLDVKCDSSSQNCTITNLPAGRKLPEDFKILIGSEDSQANCFQKVTNIKTGEIEANCKIDAGIQTGVKSLDFQIGCGNIVNMGNIDLDSGLVITSVSPNSGAFTGGELITINGENFQNVSATTYSQTATINNPSSQNLFDYQIPIILNTATLISQEKLKNDCSDLRFNDNYGELNYWLDVEKQCNKTNTTVWVKVPKLVIGNNQIKISYGDFSRNSVSNCQKTFYFCDEFKDASITNIYDMNLPSGVTIVKTAGELKISGNNDSSKYNIAGFKVNSNQSLPIFGNYSFDSDVKFEITGGGSGWKSWAGGFENSIGIYNGGSRIGYNSGTFQSLGTSSLGLNPNGWQTLGTAFNNPTDKVHFIENGKITTRSSYTGIIEHHWGFAPGQDGVNWDVRVDNLRIRNFSPDGIEPAVASLSAETQTTKQLKILIAGQFCNNLNFISNTQVTCNMPAYIGNQTNHIITNVQTFNPTGNFVLTEGYQYLNDNEQTTSNPCPDSGYTNGNLIPCTSTYLGGNGENKANKVEILSNKDIIVAGKFFNLPTAPNNHLLLNTDNNSSGVILRLDSSGKTIKSITRLGIEVDDLAIDSISDEIYAYGAFGLVKLSPDASTIVWQKSGGNIGKVDGIAIYSSGRRISVAQNGDVTILGNISASSNFNGLVHIFDKNGNNISSGNFTIPVSNIGGGTYNQTWEDISIDSETKQIFVTGKTQRCTNYQSPFVMAYSYDTANFGIQTWRSFSLWCSAADSASLTADSRGKRLDFKNGSLLFVGNSDGGNNLFTREPQDHTKPQLNNVQIDRWNNGAGFSIGKVTYFAKINPSNGLVDKGQFQFSSTGVNAAKSFDTLAITANETGDVLIGGQTFKDLPNRANLQINSNAVGARIDNETAVIGVSSNFNSRNFVATFTGMQNTAPGIVTSLATRGGLNVAIGQTSGEIVTHQPLNAQKESQNTAFLVVWGNAEVIQEEIPNQNQSLILSEINWAGSSASGNDQWIEIHNYGVEDINLNNFIVEGIGNSTNPNLTLNANNCNNLNIKAGEYFIISKFNFNNSQTLLNIAPDCVFSNLEIDKNGENMFLKNSLGQLVDEISFKN